MRAFLRLRLCLLTAVLLSGLGVSSRAAQLELPVQKELLDRISFWVERFVENYDGWVAVETLEQSRWGRKSTPEVRRVLTSDYYLVRLPPSGPLREFRDAIAVDDKLLPTAADRQQKRSQLVAATTAEAFAALLTDPAPHRLYADQFALLPLLVTRFAERYRDRVKYFFAPERGDPPADRVLVGYRQFAGEGLMDLGGQTVYPAGVAWVEPNQGTITRIVEDLRNKQTEYTLEVEFARQEPSGAWLPSRALVRILEKGRLRWQNEYHYRDWRPLRNNPAANQPAPLH
ncbi:MAG: hypothetical protein K6U09_05670 [Acidobacteriia bacterium]|jgi:hypothetical protein|nr:hypothetical protein [Terriglobia bacterium]